MKWGRDSIRDSPSGKDLSTGCLHEGRSWGPRVPWACMSPGLWLLFSWDVYKLTEHCRNYVCFSGGSKGSMAFLFHFKVANRTHFTWQLDSDKKFNLRLKAFCFKFPTLPEAVCLRTSVPARHWRIHLLRLKAQLIICWGWRNFFWLRLLVFVQLTNRNYWKLICIASVH